jgi:hypothetical protein
MRQALLPLVLVVGCNPSTSLTADGGDPLAAWQAYCPQQATRAMACGQGGDQAACLARAPCNARLIRPELTAPLIQCLLARPCGQNDDGCFSQAGQARASLPAVKSYQDSCFAKLSQCRAAQAPFLDDLCAGFGVTPDPVLEMARSCLSRPCAEVSSCFDAFVAGLGCT